MGPTMYKTILCPEFEKEGVCRLGMICHFYHYQDEQRKIDKASLAADCKTDNVSRKAPPPQEFRRWLDEQLKIKKIAPKKQKIIIEDKDIDKIINHKNIENEVEIVLPQNNENQHIQSQPEIILNPFINNEKLNRATSTPSSLPSVPH